jgi:hypothetical protein
MYTFFNSKTNIQIQRATKNANGFSTYANITTCRAYFRALNESEAALNQDQYGKAYMILTDINTDIKIGDRLLINGEKYDVKSLTKNDRLFSLKYIKANMVVNEKD